MSDDEKKTCKALAQLASEHLIDDWGESLKDMDVPESISDGRLAQLVAHVATKIRKLTWDGTP